MTIHLDEHAASGDPEPLPAQLRTIVPLEMVGAHPQMVTFDYQAADAGNARDGGVFTVNGTAFDAMLTASVGETDHWTIDNRTDWDHPFHLHGFFFQPIDTSGAPIHEWKDTYNIPAHQVRELIVHYDDRTGDWMFHCHILEHTDVGLMGMLMLR
jgi:FtsP/CotA-like multicopper oxidase with cupredoxin domain